jgi:hypothetical protein
MMATVFMIVICGIAAISVGCCAIGFQERKFGIFCVILGILFLLLCPWASHDMALLNFKDSLLDEATNNQEYVVVDIDNLTYCVVIKGETKVRVFTIEAREVVQNESEEKRWKKGCC